jgi:hypothetical protein
MATLSASVTSGSAAPSGTGHLTMSRDERVKRFGIECIGPAGDGILFKAGTWRPGGEYIQKLIIRNVSTEVKKLKYKLPSTRYFSMAYPEPIVLSPGLAQEVDVVFRPVEYEPYDDTIYIKMLDGISGNGFHIPVRATIDKLALQAPEGLDLGYCATHQITQLTFHLTNIGEIDAPYEWDVPEPFQLVPSKGIVPAGKFHEITLSIRPVDASVFVAQALCHVGKGIHAIIPDPVIVTKLSAIGKYAYISLSDSLVSFEEVTSGMIPETKEIVLANTSVVPAEYQLIRLDSDRDEVFEIHPKSGVIPPRSEVAVTINYRALAMGCYSHDRYAYRTPGNCSTVFTIKGTSMPPKVSLYKDVVPMKHKPTQQSGNNLELTVSTNGTLLTEQGAPTFSLNFRDIEIGRVETRLLFISNESMREVPFFVVGDENGIFQMSPRQGIIPPLVKSFPIKVVFSPPKPSNYYRRFFVLVGDALPLFYDCLGTGFIRAKGEVKEQRPAPIRHAHVQAYRNRAVAGFGGLNPDELDKLHENPNVPGHFFAQIGRIGTRAFSITQIQRPVTRTGEAMRNFVAPAHEFFIQPTDATAKEVTLNRMNLDFGFTAYRKSSTSKEVIIHNYTNGKVVVQWNIPITQGMEKRQNQNAHSKEREIITIDREEKELAELQAFSITPAMCDINPGQSQSFQISFVPKQSNRNFISELEAYVYFKNQRTFRLVNDFSLTPPWCLTVFAMGHTFSSGQLLAKAKFYGGNVYHNKLVFPCCYLGESIYQTVMIRNTSNLPCTFHIDVGWRAGQFDEFEGIGGGDGGHSPDKDSNSVFAVKPSVGEIAAESFVLVCIRFSPMVLKKYNDVLKLTINGDEGEKLLLEGTGALPYIIVPDLFEAKETNHLQAEDVYGINKRSMTNYSAIPRGMLGELFMKPTCIGLSSHRTITIKNATRLPCKYRLVLPKNAENILEITPTAGILKGNDDVKLHVTFSPKKLKLYQFKVNIQVYPIGGKPKRVLDANQPGPVEPPEILQDCSILLQAQGEMGALTFDPPHTVADVRLVHTNEERSIWLENISDSDLSYRLFYQELFQPDTVDESVVKMLSEVMPLRDTTSKVSHQKQQSQAMTMKSKTISFQGAEGSVMSPNPSLDATSVNQTQVQAAIQAGNAFEHSLFCEQFQGIIAARSRLRLVFTYKPVKSGLFEFTIFAQINTIHHKTHESLMIPNDTAAFIKLTGQLDLTGNLNSITLGGNSVAYDDIYTGTAMNESKSEIAGFPNATTNPVKDEGALSLLPLTAHFTARAAFPKLLFEDIRYDNAPESLQLANLSYLWKKFSLSSLNYDLSIPLTDAEIALNNSSSPDLSKLKIYNFEFLPQVLNAPMQSITIRLRNHGYLKTSYHFHLPNEKQLELENWCDEEDPSEELNRLICIIEELKLFSIEPKEATLMPGESCNLKISYRHTSLKYNGLHNIPILVKIAQGKQFYLNIKGQTLQTLSRKTSVKIVDPKAASTAMNSMTVGSPGAPSRLGGASTAVNGASGAADILLVFGDCGTNSYDSNVITLKSVPIGLSPFHTNGYPVKEGTKVDFAPMQRVELINVSSYSINYEVILGTHLTKGNPGGDVSQASTSSLASASCANNALVVRGANHQMEMLQITNPVGTILPTQSVFLEFYFYPLEVKTYFLPFAVKYSVAPANASSNLGNTNNLSVFSSDLDGQQGALRPTLSRKGSQQGGRRTPKSSAMQSRSFDGFGFGGNNNPLPMVYEFLNATLRVEGYDPRQPRPIPFVDQYIGGAPPREVVLTYPDKPIVIPQDFIAFHTIPQDSITRRILILNNVSNTAIYEFAIDETSSQLAMDGILQIKPVFGKIEPRGRVVVELTIQSYCQAILFEENIKIMVKEIIKHSNKSRGGTRQQLLDRIKSRKVSLNPL